MMKERLLETTEPTVCGQRSPKGKIGMFAENVLGYLRIDKGGPRCSMGYGF